MRTIIISYISMFTRIVISILFLCDATAIWCQPRINSSDKFEVVSESQVITNPIGWSYSELDEKWCGYYGICSDIYERNSEKPRKCTPFESSLYLDRGIYSLQMKKVRTNDRCFYLLYHIYWDGQYEYPSIKVGWDYYKSCTVWVITEEEYNKLANLQIGINTIILYDRAMSSRYSAPRNIDYVKSQLNKIITDATQANVPYNPKFKSGFKLYVKLENDNSTIRFQLPTDKLLWDVAQTINEQNEQRKQSEETYFYTPISKYDCIDFNKKYFEISRSLFDKLIIHKTGKTNLYK